MASPLLETKLYVPRARRGVVQRARLIERLNQAIESKLTLVSAAPGFGKTTLLAEWLAQAQAQPWVAAWVSLDQQDNNPRLFWSYVISALRTVEPGFGAHALELLQSPQPPPIEALLAPLLNELRTISRDLVLVLDDYHVVDARDIQHGLVFMLEHLPPRAHLVLASRADPPFPLARLRARGELVEIRAADLRFLPEEAVEYLDRGNLFVVPLDNRRTWYRYHHLFADVVYAHLLEEHGDGVQISSAPPRCSSRPPRSSVAIDRRRWLSAGLWRCPMTSSTPGQFSARRMPRRCWRPVTSRVSRPDWMPPSAGSIKRFRRGDRLSATKRTIGICRARSPSIAPRAPRRPGGSAADLCRGRAPHAAGREHV